MSGHFGWLVWLIFGGLFLFLMFRGGGCCGGHGGRVAKGSDGHADKDGKPADDTSPRKQAPDGCH